MAYSTAEEAERRGIIEELERQDLIAEFEAEDKAKRLKQQSMSHTSTQGQYSDPYRLPTRIPNEEMDWGEATKDLGRTGIQALAKTVKGFGDKVSDLVPTDGVLGRDASMDAGREEAFKPALNYATDNNTIERGANDAQDAMTAALEHGLPIVATGGLAKTSQLLGTGGRHLSDAAKTLLVEGGFTGLGAGGGSLADAGTGDGQGTGYETMGSFAGILGDPQGLQNVGNDINNWIKKGGAKANVHNASNRQNKAAYDMIQKNLYDKRTVGSPTAGADFDAEIIRLTDALKAKGLDVDESLAMLSGNSGLKQMENFGVENDRLYQGTREMMGERANLRGLQSFDDVIDDIGGNPARATGVVKSDNELANSLRDVEATMKGNQAVGSAQQTVTKAADDVTNQARNFEIEALSSASPNSSIVTQQGRKGVKQLKGEFNTNYKEAWGKAGEVPDSTINKIKDDLTKQLDIYFEGDKTALHQVINSADAMGKTTNKAEALANFDQVLGGAAYRADGGLKTVMQDARATLRGNIEPDALKQLQATDSKYPEFLAVQSASGKNAKNRGKIGVESLATESRLTLGKSNTGTGDTPSYDMIADSYQTKVAKDEALKAAEDMLRKAERQAKNWTAEAKKANIASSKSKLGLFGKTEATEHYRAVSPYIDAIHATKGNPTPLKDIEDLLATANGDPTKLADLKSAFVDAVKQSHRSDDGFIKMDAIKKFKKERKILEGKVMTTSQADNIANGMEEANKMYVGIDRDKLALIKDEQRILAEAGAAVTGAKMGGYLLDSQLIGAGIGRKFMVGVYKNMTTFKAKRIALEMTLNPDKYAAMAKKVRDGTTGTREWDKAWYDLFSRASVEANVNLED